MPADRLPDNYIPPSGGIFSGCGAGGILGNSDQFLEAAGMGQLQEAAGLGDAAQDRRREMQQMVDAGFTWAQAEAARRLVLAGSTWAEARLRVAGKTGTSASIVQQADTSQAGLLGGLNVAGLLPPALAAVGAYYLLPEKYKTVGALGAAAAIYFALKPKTAGGGHELPLKRRDAGDDRLALAGHAREPAGVQLDRGAVGAGPNRRAEPVSGIFSGTGGVLGGYAEEQAAMAKRFGAPSNGASHPWGQGSGYGYRPYSMMRIGTRPNAGGGGVALGDVAEIWEGIPSWMKWGGLLFAVIALLKVKRSNPGRRRRRARRNPASRKRAGHRHRWQPDIAPDYACSCGAIGARAVSGPKRGRILPHVGRGYSRHGFPLSRRYKSLGGRLPSLASQEGDSNR